MDYPLTKINVKYKNMKISKIIELITKKPVVVTKRKDKRKEGDAACSTPTPVGLTPTETKGRTNNAAQQVPTPSAAEKSKSQTEGWVEVIRNTPSRHSGQAVDTHRPQVGEEILEHGVVRNKGVATVNTAAFGQAVDSQGDGLTERDAVTYTRGYHNGYTDALAAKSGQAVDTEWTVKLDHNETDYGWIVCGTQKISHRLRVFDLNGIIQAHNATLKGQAVDRQGEWSEPRYEDGVVRVYCLDKIMFTLGEKYFGTADAIRRSVNSALAAERQRLEAEHLITAEKYVNTHQQLLECQRKLESYGS